MMIRPSAFLWLALVLLLIGSAVLAAPGNDAMTSPGYCRLIIEGKDCQPLYGFSGGGMNTDIVVNAMNPTGIASKQMGLPTIDELHCTMKMPLPLPVIDWVNKTSAGTSQMKTVGIRYYNDKNVLVWEKEYIDCLLTSLTLPADDSLLTVAQYVILTIQPERGRYIPAAQSANVDPATTYTPSVVTAVPKFELPGFNTADIKSIDPVTIRFGLRRRPVSNMPASVYQTTGIELPNLTFYVPLNAADPWRNWYDTFVMKKRNDDTQKKAGVINWYDASRHQCVLKAEMRQMGIFHISEVDTYTTTPRLKVELFCEGFAIIPATATPPAGNTTPPANNGNGPHRLGKQFPIDVTLTELEYTISREWVTNEIQIDAPTAEQKLLVARYTLTNAGAEDLDIDWSLLKSEVTDTAGVTTAYANVGVQQTRNRLAGKLHPQESVACFAVFPVAAKLDVAALTFSHGLEAGRVKIPVTGKARLRETYAQDTTVAATSAFTALAEIPFPLGEKAFRPLLLADYRLESVAFGPRPRIELATPEATRALVVTFTLRNGTPAELPFDFGTVAPSVILGDGTEVVWNGFLLAGKGDRAVMGAIKPNAEVQLRVFFDIPNDARLAAFRFVEGESRSYTTPLKKL